MRLRNGGGALRARLPRRLPAEPWSVLAALVVVQWIGVALFAHAVTHNGWLFYHGGDQTWYYTSSWLLGDGRLPETQIGYGWSYLLIPLTWFTGPNFLGGLPAIIVAQVLLLLPLGTVAIYGAGTRLGGRVVGYAASAIWALGPFVTIPMFLERYHDRYTAQFLPQVLGLTGLGDFPATVALVLAAYFFFRAVDGGTFADAAACGLAAGFALAIKPSNALFLAAPVVALLAARRFRHLGAFTAAVAPLALTLAVWKARGVGNVPVLSAPAERVAAGAMLLPHESFFLARLPSSVKLDWGHLAENWRDLQDFFFSARLLQWVPLAGTLAVARRNWVHALFLATWLAGYVVIKGSSPVVNVEDGGFWRLLMPAFPAFCLLAAAVPLLWPRTGLHLPRRYPPLGRPFVPLVPAVAGAVVIVGLVPLALISTARIHRPPLAAKFFIENIYLPISSQIDLKVRTGARGIQYLTWTAPPTSGTKTFFRVFRTPYTQPPFQGNPPQLGDPSVRPWGREGIRCLARDFAPTDCRVEMSLIATTTKHEFAEGVGTGHWTYRVGMAANYLDDPTRGDVLILSPPVDVRVG